MGFFGKSYSFNVWDYENVIDNRSGEKNGDYYDNGFRDAIESLVMFNDLTPEDLTGSALEINDDHIILSGKHTYSNDI